MRCTTIIENRCTKPSCDTQLTRKQEKTENVHVFTHILAGFKADNVSSLKKCYCSFTYLASYRHLSMIDYVKCLSNESSWLHHDQMLEFSINRPTTSKYDCFLSNHYPKIYVGHCGDWLRQHISHTCTH